MSTFIVSEFPDGNTISVPYQDWISGKRDPLIISNLYGQQLFSILFNDLGQIVFRENEFAWNFDLTYNKDTRYNLLGKIAEAVVVQRCHQNASVNELFIKYARRGNRKPSETFASKYCAVGTGLLTTQKMFPKFWQPGDTQRDVVWVDISNPNPNKQMLLQQINSTLSSGSCAGLQIKVSSNGMKYIYQPLIKHTYYYPVLYFGTNGDFAEIAQTLMQNGYLHQDMIGVDFIDAKAVDPVAYDQVCNYAYLIENIFSGKMQPIDLIRYANNDTTLATAISATVLSGIGIPSNY